MAEEKESKLETTEVSRAPRNRRKKTTTVSVAKNSIKNKLLNALNAL